VGRAFRSDDDYGGAWSDSITSLKATTRRAWLRCVHHFCLFRRRDDPHSFVTDATQFPPRGSRPLPYIFSESDIGRLLTIAERLKPHAGSPLHREAARLGIVVLYTTGLRRGELVRLLVGDYDAAARVLRVRQSKFDKSRLVPLSGDTALEFQCYLAARRQLGTPCDGETPLLMHTHGAAFLAYSGGGFGQLVDLAFQHLAADDVLALLDHLEMDRKNGVATRNARLAAIHAFARFMATREPEHRRCPSSLAARVTAKHG